MSSPRGGSKKLGKYEILEVIGRGGMGVVYKAVDPEIGRLVGIKMMTSAVINDPDLLKRFYREAQSAGKLQHPNIITIYDLGVHDATPYLVMEFLEGESLDATIKSRRAMSLEDKLNIAIQVCNALAYAHERSVVHRDIKPANVMLLKDGTVKIVDFGIARMGGDKVTRTGQVMGSIQYMSPEQINGAHVDQRTDIFSAGVLLYQLLTNVLPFEGKDTGDTLLKIIHGTPPSLSQFLQQYPPELETIVLRALAKDPEERYQTGTELALDLSHVQDELKRERMSEYLQSAEASIAEAQWTKAKEQLLQVLKIDRQNVRGVMLLREVQQEIQKQQRSERAKDLRSQADQALARGELDEALRYLGMAVDLVPGNAELLRLRDSVKEKKARVDKLTQLLRRAESAHDGGDLEEALTATEEALEVDAESTEAKALHAVITRELAERVKLKQVQSFIDEARRQISSRRFTAALEVLKKAEQLDPTATGINELVSLASTGQQQERRRKELEQIAADVQEALNRSDHLAACALAEEGLQKFPEDRGLLKLKALADKEREAHQKRTYIEKQVSLGRRLLEERRAQEALAPLEEALARYPDEFVLQTMYSLVTESIEREQTEQFKARTIQQAKEAIRRKAYNEAVDILQAAQRQTPCSEFEDLLQFAADEAAAHEKQLVIDAAAEEAHRLISADEYKGAIALLERTLKTHDDQELRIILADAQRHLEQFNAGLQETIAAAHRLRQSQRCSEAVKFMEGQLQNYGKAPEFRAALEEMRAEERRLHALVAVKEQAREALANSDYEAALAVVETFRQEFGDGPEAQLLQNEIAYKREQVSAVAVEQALKDVRVLFLVRSYRSALGVLDRVASDAARVAPELRERYQVARTNAESVLEREREANEHRERRERELVERMADQPTLEESAAGDETAVAGRGERTQQANPTELEELLGEVTLVGQHYAEDETIQSVISDLKEKLTVQIAELRQTEVLEQATLVAAVPPPAAGEVTGVSEGVGAAQPESKTTSGLPSRLEAEAVQEPPLAPAEAVEMVAPAEEKIEPAEQPSAVVLGGVPAIPVEPPAMPEPVQVSALGESPISLAAAEVARSEEMAAAELEEPEGEQEEASVQLVAEQAITDVEQPAFVQPMSAAEIPIVPSSAQDAVPPVLTTSPVPAEVEQPEQPVLVRPVQTPARPAPPAVTEAAHPAPRRPQPPKRDTGLRPPPVVPPAWRKPAVVAGLAVVAIAATWAVVHRLIPNKPATTSTAVKAPAVAPPARNPLELQQKQAVADADKRVAAGDLEGARQILQHAAGLNGPLTGEVDKKLAGIDAAMNDQGLRKLRQREEQLWQQAQTDVAEGRFTAAQKSLRQILALPDGATRREEARAYLNDTLPKRKKEESLFAQAQRASQAGDAASLQHAEDLLSQVIGLDGARKTEAEQLRTAVHDRVTAGLNQQHEQQINGLQGEARQAVRQGDFRTARQKADEIKRLGGDAGSLSAEIDQAENSQQSRAAADASFQRALQRYRSATSANDKAALEGARSDLVAIAQAGGPHASEAQNYISELDKKLAALNQPPVTPPASKPSGPTPADLDAIRTLVQRYAQAFEQRDADALRRIWPSLNSSMYSAYKTNFGNASAISMSVEIKSINASPDGQSATASALVTQKYTPKGYSAHSSRDTALFQLAKTGDVWVIADVR
ncbi:MAG: protein kinase [Acidobacteriia bacterium]|nr:protein kinase [Terriglobia bacterium]